MDIDDKWDAMAVMLRLSGTKIYDVLPMANNETEDVFKLIALTQKIAAWDRMNKLLIDVYGENYTDDVTLDIGGYTGGSDT